MLDDELTHNQKLLATYRRNLKHLIQQAALYGGEPYALIPIMNGIADARKQIQRIKKTLRDKDYVVDDESDDESPVAPEIAIQSGKGLWSCPNCKSENAPNTKFCLSCGTQLIRECPECEKETSLISTGICSKCGYTHELASHRADLKRQRQQLQSEIDTIISRDGDIREAMSKEESFWNTFFMWLLGLTLEGGFIVLIISVLLFYSPSEYYSKLAPIGLTLYIPVIFVISIISHNISSTKRTRGKAKLVQLKPLQDRLQTIDAELADTNLRQSNE